MEEKSLQLSSSNLMNSKNEIALTFGKVLRKVALSICLHQFCLIATLEVASERAGATYQNVILQFLIQYPCSINLTNSHMNSGTSFSNHKRLLFCTCTVHFIKVVVSPVTLSKKNVGNLVWFRYICCLLTPPSQLFTVCNPARWIHSTLGVPFSSVMISLW